ncbi:MAG TPA: hypothetical protein VF790_05370 [Dissulfurispiraceae bacterium]
MRDKYYDVYRDLYEDYQMQGILLTNYLADIPLRPHRQPRRTTLRMVVNAIDAAIGELGLTKRIRPDARLFLLVNLHQMVVLPLSSGVEPGLERADLEATLERDVTTILRNAAERAEGSEISAHAILDATADTWRALGVNRFETWG